MPISVSPVAAFALVLSSSVMSVQSVHAQAGHWYVGAGTGISRLTPDTDGSDLALDDDSSVATGVYLGLDINHWLGIEAAYTDLGEAGLSEGESVTYSALSLGGIAYVLGETDARHRQDGWSGYVRLGLNNISNKSDIDLTTEDDTALWLGAGIQWPVGPAWGVRGELTSFDGDSQAALASVYWRPVKQGSRMAGSSRIPTVAVSRPVKSAAPLTKPLPEPITRRVPLPRAPVSRPLSAPSMSSCAVPAAGEPLDSRGCALFSGVLQGVEFEGDTATLTPIGEALLARLAGSLNLYPRLIVEIRVYTQTYTDPDRARSLSRDRAIAVARFLLSQGVDVKRLRARAFGSAHPRAGNDTPGGRRLNNRVALGVL